MFFGLFDSNSTKIEMILTTDIHSHLIAGIDDGAKTVEESLELLRGLYELGYRKVVTTPHIMSDFYTNNRATILSGLEHLREASEADGIEMEIEAAAEYYLDDGFYKHLEEGNPLTLNGNYLLFETSYVEKPLQFDEMIFAISSRGYKPLLAHPERYQYIKDPLNEYLELKERGIFFQVNLNSFGGYYGKDAQTKAMVLHEHGLIDFLGSDTHKMKHVETLKKVQQLKLYPLLLEKNNILNHTL